MESEATIDSMPRGVLPMKQFDTRNRGLQAYLNLGAAFSTYALPWPSYPGPASQPVGYVDWFRANALQYYRPGKIAGVVMSLSF